ncbi:MAG TPA: transglycosylase SLT domain-containing protein [Deltaproteobacteria bacterium]|nr:transglycosylase SLT domain-containing protein [Deltaproteobacteria bacterium]
MGSRIRVAAVLMGVFLFWLPSFSQAGQEPFPVYKSIEPNVAFWRDIYAKYPSSKGLIHDNQDLAIVYEVVSFGDGDRSWSSKANRNKIKKIKEKYEQILLHLAKGPAKTEEEKRVAALFGPGTTAKRFRAARNNIRFQLGQKDLFQAGIIRSGAYLSEIKEIFKEHRVPDDLAYLPHVESSFNYKAYSKFGAAGIWQFTRSTGKRFMVVDYALDERRDPIRAAHGAARLLKGNFEKLGSWPLAITAYNHGATGMQKAKNAHGDYERIFNDYDGQRFGFASRNFYSEFLAAREVAKDYKKHFGSLRIMSPLHGREIIMPGYVRVDELVKHLKVDMATFRELNPALREPVYSGQKYIPKGYHLRLPEQSQVLRLAANLPANIIKTAQKRSSFYLVQRGDTVGVIARRHGVKLQDMLLANNLDSRAKIYEGQNLRIPQPDEQVVQLAAVAKKQKVASLPQRLASLGPPVSLPAPLKKVKPEQPAPPAPSPVKVETAAAVKEPETEVINVPQGLETARTRTAEILTSAGAANTAAVKYDQFAMYSAHDEKASGQPQDAAADKAVMLANPDVVMGKIKVARVVTRQGKSYGLIQVEAEETLGHYAEWLGVRARDLRRLNGFKYRQAIMIDQQLEIPLGKVDKDRFEEQRYEYHKEMEEDFFGAYRVDGVRRYKVKRGDNIWALCQGEFEVPFWLIKKYNADLDFNLLKPEQQVVVPLVESIS